MFPNECKLCGMDFARFFGSDFPYNPITSAYFLLDDVVRVKNTVPLQASEALKVSKSFC